MSLSIHMSTIHNFNGLKATQKIFQNNIVLYIDDGDE